MRPPLTAPQEAVWSGHDGYALRGRLWPPATGSPARTPVIYLHGIQSHGGWYEWSASILAAGGRPVLMPDRRGSGLNAVDRGDVHASDDWLRDVDAVADWAAREFGTARVALAGVSWGGRLAAAWAASRHARVAGLLLLAPGIFARVGRSARYRARVVGQLLTRPSAHSRLPLDDPALFTDNPAAQAFIRADRLKLETASARFLYWSTMLERKVQRLPLGAIGCPTLLMLAGRDRIIHNEETTAWARRVCGGGLEIVEHAEDAHTLEFAADPTHLAKTIERWERSLSP